MNLTYVIIVEEILREYEDFWLSKDEIMDIIRSRGLHSHPSGYGVGRALRSLKKYGKVVSMEKPVDDGGGGLRCFYSWKK